MRKLIYTAGMVAIFAAAFVVVQRARPNPLPTPAPSPPPPTAGPKITWSVSQLTPTLFPGETMTATATFTSDAALQNVAVEAVPAISSFLTIQPSSFATIPAGQPQRVQISFSIPTSTAIGGIFDGTVHLRIGSQTFPQTLKITITIAAQSVSRSDMGLIMKYPIDWPAPTETDDSVILGTDTANDFSFFQVGYMPQANPNLLSISNWFAEFSAHLSGSPGPGIPSSVGGHPAVYIDHGTGDMVPQMTFYVSKGPDIFVIAYKSGDSFLGEYQAILGSMTF